MTWPYKNEKIIFLNTQKLLIYCSGPTIANFVRFSYRVEKSNWFRWVRTKSSKSPETVYKDQVTRPSSTARFKYREGFYSPSLFQNAVLRRSCRRVSRGYLRSNCLFNRNVYLLFIVLFNNLLCELNVLVITQGYIFWWIHCFKI